MFGDLWRGMMLYKLNRRVLLGRAGLLAYPKTNDTIRLACNRVCYHSVGLEEVGHIYRPKRGRYRSKQ